MPKAILFDMDGVIVDTMDLHYEAAQKTLSGAGLAVSKEELKKLDSARSSDTFKLLLKSKSKKDIGLLLEKKYSYLKDKTRGIKPIPGFPEFFGIVREKFLLGVVSSSTREFVEHVLGQLSIRKDFSVVLGGDDVANGKPEPDGYMKAADLLGVKPQDCLVIEDSIFGVMSAKKAGMKVVAVTTTYSKFFLLDSDLVVDSLSELSLEQVRGLLGP